MRMVGKVLNFLCSEDGPPVADTYIPSYHLVNIIFTFLGPLRLFVCTKSFLRKEDSSYGPEFCS